MSEQFRVWKLVKLLNGKADLMQVRESTGLDAPTAQNLLNTLIANGNIELLDKPAGEGSFGLWYNYKAKKPPID